MAVNRFALAALAGSLLLAAPVSAQSTTGVVSGRVLDSASRQPLAAVTIRIAGSTIGGQTRADGSFSIRGVPAGAQVVAISHSGRGFTAAVLRKAARVLEDNHEEFEQWLIREGGAIPGKAAFDDAATSILVSSAYTSKV